ncbi:uncharacterized protein LOC129939734 [Eupeodes corollae]|uniref:uncharacterized protein LOC129939734 n=1 Tax=Eupeodes corollae TaxID=290404 RepID=UPI002490DA7C|nr:uncharacterized protein LOC129939734 [Eupeodes corollae]
MSLTYQIGSLCDDCQRLGLQNYLKPFYINLDEQITKCESSSCMFPYLRKPIITEVTNCKPPPLENTLFLEELIEEKLQEIENGTPAVTAIKPNIQNYTAKEEINNTDMYDFSAIFMSSPIKTEVKEKPLMFQSSVKQEPNLQPVVLESKVIKNSWSVEDPKVIIKSSLKDQIQTAPKKMRISRCLSDVKPSVKPSKKSKAQSEKVEPVFVIEPNSGKSMRPLDLIKRYMKNKN